MSVGALSTSSPEQRPQGSLHGCPCYSCRDISKHKVEVGQDLSDPLLLGQHVIKGQNDVHGVVAFASLDCCPTRVHHGITGKDSVADAVGRLKDLLVVGPVM